MRLFDRLFLQHPRSVGETYYRHMCIAIKVSIRLLYSAVFQLIHAFIPGINPPLGSDLESLEHFIYMNKPKQRKLSNDE